MLKLKALVTMKTEVYIGKANEFLVTPNSLVLSHSLFCHICPFQFLENKYYKTIQKW